MRRTWAGLLRYPLESAKTRAPKLQEVRLLTFKTKAGLESPEESVPKNPHRMQNMMNRAMSTGFRAEK